MLTTAVVLFTVSAGLFIVAVVAVTRTHSLITNGEITYGTAVLPEAQETTDTTARVYLEYHRSSGELVRLDGSRSARSGKLRQGERVLLVFDPARERRHKVLSFLDLWYAPLSVSAVGLCVCLLGMLAVFLG